MGSSHSAGYGGSTQVTVTEGNTSAPTYVVLSAGLSGEVAYSEWFKVLTTPLNRSLFAR